MFLAACVQVRGTRDVAANLATVERFVRRAAGWGATFVATPENTPFVGPAPERVALAEPLEGPIVTRFRDLARECRIHLLLGSFAEAIPLPGGGWDPTRSWNTSALLGPDGTILATYRKIHLFDAEVPGQAPHRESDSMVPGTEVEVVDTPLGRVGLSICYDLRFPGLYQVLGDRGAEILCVPAAFTLMTGRDHWDPLLRARAVETQCWVVAPGQWGPHDDDGTRRSWGRSSIVDPWGTVVARCGDGEGICLAEVDLDRVREIRASMPVAAHRRI
ncbi:MAG: carbon-nitrogen hydrolase family protein [Deltaproteobacteria bacterium]|nr:carbon-nitrogen hydrolase family protein [Deltaproteobacteria bacterium]